MEEHDQNLNIEIEKPEEDAVKQPANGSHRIANSIIVGAILISASIVYSGNLVAKYLVSPQVLGVTDALGSAPQTEAPTGPVSVADRSNEPMLGDKNAKVTIVEFGDFQCPYCQNFFKETFPKIKSQYIDTGKVKYIFRHYPLSFHVNAQIAAVAAECANQQGKFWEYHDLLYTDGQSDGTGLAPADLKKYADSLNLNAGTFGFGTNKFNQCLDGKATLQIVKDDSAEGTKDEVSGTPTFYVNGKSIVGAQDFDVFQQAIDVALK
ncbi:MAG TPA: DsbA family protein [Candidatus Limnocylindria bacterium]|nr:DsbA family protein [Candidatus Limnocylindria bacterium]